MAGSLLPYFLLREFDNAGKLLSGGKMYFYISGTSTPKTVYSDADLTIPLPNPVILSASGTQNIFLGEGSYRVRIEDQYGAQVAPPIDGITGTTGSAAEGTNISYAFVKLYADLRTLAGTPDVVYVSGRLVEGDGGQGWFQLLTTGTSGLTDDDGIILTKDSGTHVYKRIFDAAIDPLWFGLTYGLAVNQTIYVNKAIAASVQWNFPALFAGSTYISQNITVPVNASISFTDDGFFVASSAVNVTFADNSHLKCVGRNFGTYVSPKIGKNVIDVLRLSYMGDTSADARMDKLLLASTDVGQPVDIDEQISILASTWVCVNTLTISGRVTFTGSAPLSWTSKYMVLENRQQFVISSTGTQFFDFGNRFCSPEMFGAAADGATDDTAKLFSAASSKYVQLTDGKTYKANSNISFTDLHTKGNGTISLSASATLLGTTLEMDGGSIAKASGTWYTGTNLFAQNTGFPSNAYSITGAISLSGCSFADDSRYPVYNGTTGPSLYNAHLPLIPSAGILSTNSVGKIYKKMPTELVYNGGEWFGMNGASTAPNAIQRIKYVNGNWWMLASNNKVWKSPDMVAWTSVPVGLAANSQPHDIVWTGTHYVIWSWNANAGTYPISDNQVARSPDGAAWSVQTLSPQYSIYGTRLGCNGANVWMGDISGMIYSNDSGATWNYGSFIPSDPNWYGGYNGYLAGLYISANNNGGYAYKNTLSPGSWTVVSDPMNGAMESYILCLWYDPILGKYKMLTSKGECKTRTALTPDGTWGYDTYPFATDPSYYDAHYAKGLALAVGPSGILATVDGTTTTSIKNNELRTPTGTSGVVLPGNVGSYMANRDYSTVHCGPEFFAIATAGGYPYISY